VGGEIGPLRLVDSWIGYRVLKKKNQGHDLIIPLYILQFEPLNFVFEALDMVSIHLIKPFKSLKFLP